jgi:hypothetical protein
VEGTEKMVAEYADQAKKYDEASNKIRKEAEGSTEEAKADEHRALWYDVGEGLLEIGLVLSSLYFISRKGMFPVLGIIAGIAGVAFAITGYMM